MSHACVGRNVQKKKDPPLGLSIRIPSVEEGAWNIVVYYDVAQVVSVEVEVFFEPDGRRRC